jgi:hypothetical protein
MVARQFIAWDMSKKESPSRRERYDLVPDLPEPTRCSRLPLVREMRVSGSVYPLRSTRLGLANHTVPYGTDLSLNSIQAINCLASAPWNAHHRR